MYQIIGIAMIAILFGVLFAIMSHESGIKVAAFVFIAVFGIVTWICIAAYFLQK